MSTTTTNPKVKFIGVLVIIAGALMIVAGGVTWGMVSSQLKAEHIVVAAITPENPGRLAGKPARVLGSYRGDDDVFGFESLDGAGGRTYAQIGDDAKALKAKLAADGLSKEEVAKNPDVLALAATRDSTMNGSFLRASLFTSVVAYGVAALVIGLGVLFALVGVALTRLSAETVTASPAEGAEPSVAKA